MAIKSATEYLSSLTSLWSSSKEEEKEEDEDFTASFVKVPRAALPMCMYPPTADPLIQSFAAPPRYPWPAQKYRTFLDCLNLQLQEEDVNVEEIRQKLIASRNRSDFDNFTLLTLTALATPTQPEEQFLSFIHCLRSALMMAITAEGNVNPYYKKTLDCICYLIYTKMDLFSYLQDLLSLTKQASHVSPLTTPLSTATFMPTILQDREAILHAPDWIKKQDPISQLMKQTACRCFPFRLFEITSQRFRLNYVISPLPHLDDSVIKKISFVVSEICERVLGTSFSIYKPTYCPISLAFIEEAQRRSENVLVVQYESRSNFTDVDYDNLVVINLPIENVFLSETGPFLGKEKVADLNKELCRFMHHKMHGISLPSSFTTTELEKILTHIQRTHFPQHETLNLEERMCYILLMLSYLKIMLIPMLNLSHIVSVYDTTSIDFASSLSCIDDLVISLLHGEDSDLETLGRMQTNVLSCSLFAERRHISVDALQLFKIASEHIHALTIEQRTQILCSAAERFIPFQVSLTSVVGQAARPTLTSAATLQEYSIYLQTLELPIRITRPLLEIPEEEDLDAKKVLVEKQVQRDLTGCDLRLDGRTYLDSSSMMQAVMKHFKGDRRKSLSFMDLMHQGHLAALWTVSQGHFLPNQVRVVMKQKESPAARAYAIFATHFKKDQVSIRLCLGALLQRYSRHKKYFTREFQVDLLLSDTDNPLTEQILQLCDTEDHFEELLSHLYFRGKRDEIVIPTQSNFSEAFTRKGKHSINNTFILGSLFEETVTGVQHLALYTSDEEPHLVTPLVGRITSNFQAKTIVFEISY